VVNFLNKYLNPLSSALGIFYLKKYSIVFLCLFISTLAYSQAELKVSQPKHNFGYVKRGTIVKIGYEITNTGKEPLIIQEAEVSCSCTSVEFSKQPLLPGEKTIVEVSFDTKTVYGRQDRVVLLHCNIKDGPTKLRYKGTVSNK
jgi:hypothetical protein